MRQYTYANTSVYDVLSISIIDKDDNCMQNKRIVTFSPFSILNFSPIAHSQC